MLLCDEVFWEEPALINAIVFVLSKALVFTPSEEVNSLAARIGVKIPSAL